MSVESIQEWSQYVFPLNDVHFGKTSESQDENDVASFLIGVNGQSVQQVASSGKIIKSWPTQADLTGGIALLKNGALWTTAQEGSSSKLLKVYDNDMVLCLDEKRQQLILQTEESVIVANLLIETTGHCMTFAVNENNIYLLFNEFDQLVLKSYHLTKDSQLSESSSIRIPVSNKPVNMQSSICPKTLRICLLDHMGHLEIFGPTRSNDEYVLAHELNCIDVAYGATATCQLLASVDPGYSIMAIKTELSSLVLSLVDLVHGNVTGTKLVSEHVACWPIKSSMVDDSLLVIYDAKTLFICALDLPVPSMKRVMFSKKKPLTTISRTHYQLSESALEGSIDFWSSFIKAQDKEFNEKSAKLQHSKTKTKSSSVTGDLLQLCLYSSHMTRATVHKFLGMEGNEKGLDALLERRLLSSFEYPDLVSRCLEKNMTHSLAYLLEYLEDFQEPDILRILEYVLDDAHDESIKEGKQEPFPLTGWEYLVSMTMTLSYNASFMQQCLSLLSTQKAMRLLSLLFKWLQYWRETSRWSTLPLLPSYHQVMNWLNLYLDAFYPRLSLLPEFIPLLLELKSVVQEESEVFKSMGELHDYLTFYFDRKNVRPKLESYMIEIFPLLKQ